MGGDEFCILFLDKGDEEVRAICQSLHSAFYAASAHTEYSNVRVSIASPARRRATRATICSAAPTARSIAPSATRGSICVDDGMEGMGAHDPGRAVLEAEAKAR